MPITPRPIAETRRPPLPIARICIALAPMSPVRGYRPRSPTGKEVAMRAAVMRANHSPLEIEEVAIDAPGPGEVLVRTAASGICHSDLHVVEGTLPMPPPCILGHEPSGVVEEVGAGVAGFEP